MSLLAAWRLVRARGRLCWKRIQCKIMLQAWSQHRASTDRSQLNAEIHFCRICWGHRLALLDCILAAKLRDKCASVKADKRNFAGAVVREAARAAEKGDTNVVFASFRKLEPYKARLIPMVKQLDGSWARAPTEIAERWRQHAALPLGEAPVNFDTQRRDHSVVAQDHSPLTWQPPTLDDVIDYIQQYKRGQALGTDLIPVELLLAGGLPAAVLLHRLVTACWQQLRVPLLWKGGRLIYLEKRGGVKFTCEDKRGILINDQMATIFGRMLRPQLLALAPQLVPLSQAFGPARRGSVLAAHCSWALFTSAKHQGFSAGALYSDLLQRHSSTGRGHRPA